MLRGGILSQRLLGLGALLKPKTVVGLARGFATSGVRREGSFIEPQPQFDTPMTRPEEKRPNVMKVIDREAVARADVDGRTKMFARRAAPRDRMCAGDIVFVESLNSMSDPSSTSSFCGVCIAIYRRGLDTSFILRNMVVNVGVEMRYMAYSPLIKKIEVVQKAARFRRAKLFYLRDNPGKTFQVKALRQMGKPAAPAKRS
ncbi:hypothetical protein GGF46_005167 [Coemansia sp. RSA 552]|nr:hypothetical protein GGF46_005167 [Coemansia sp. RSA 552]